MIDRLRSIVFDVDGTLAETEEAHRKAFNAAFAAFGLDWSWSVEEYRGLLRTTGGKERMIAFQHGLPKGAPRLDHATIASLHREKTRRYGEFLRAGGVASRPGVERVIAEARRRGMAVAIATTTSPGNVEQLCRCCFGAAARDVFDVVAAGDEVADKKPAPDIYVLALSRLGLQPGECLAFEDSENGVRAAKDAGLHVVAAPSRYTDEDDFSCADLVLRDLSAFAFTRPVRGWA
jgi:HAD superfamily hydrolase (TIGR01509 family)